MARAPPEFVATLPLNNNRLNIKFDVTIKNTAPPEFVTAVLSIKVLSSITLFRSDEMLRNNAPPFTKHLLLSKLECEITR
jgi:hypothetical protein